MYEAAVTDPERWGEGPATEWADELFATRTPERETAKYIRRAIRVSLKLAEFWRDPPESVPADVGEWQTRVDIALGARAWRPVLETARIGLRNAPTEELFAEVKRRFRVVHHSFWMEDVSYLEWLDTRRP